MPSQNSSPARLAAPIALVVVAIAFLFVVATSGTDESGGDKASTKQETSTERSTTPKRTVRRVSTYTVKTGDTLGGIAEKTGVKVETLQELNPELDPQALVSGQKIKLRE